jgi:hypothetical protein
MSSHASVRATTSLLTVLCLALVHRERPDWLAIGVADAASAAALAPERVSRLATRAEGLFKDVIATLTRRGRPRRERLADAMQGEVIRLRALLTVATMILGLVSFKKPAIRAAVLGAWLRLSTEHPSLTKTEFCKTLSVSERTFRQWLRAPSASRPATPSPSPSPKPKPRKRPPRRPRFTFDVFLPDTQIGADTTDLSAFGVPLKLVGVQDIGGRDQSLFDSVVIDTSESSTHVIDALRPVLRDCPGAQAITDQGTPYMAHDTRAELAALEVEHAPQKEGDPTGKATVEKGFDTLKAIAHPLLALSGSIAELAPALRSAAIALPFARLVVGTVLRAYQAGARATRRAVEARGAASEDDLVRAAARAREAARADDRSARLLLTHLHDVFRIEGSCSDFVARFRRYPLDVLRSAEAALTKRLLLCGAPYVRSIAHYFGAIIRSEYREQRLRRIERDASHKLNARLHREQLERSTAYRAHLNNPTRWLREALDLIAMHWLPDQRALLFGGDGLGIAWMRGALAILFSRHSATPTADLVAGVLHDFRSAHLASLGDDGCAAIASILERETALVRARAPTPVAPPPAGATLFPIGLFSRSIDPNPLQN